MRYEDKFIKHKATKSSPKWNEILANVEFSEENDWFSTEEELNTQVYLRKSQNR